MAAYSNLSNNEISKGLLVNKLNMIFDSQGRLVLDEQSIASSHNKPHKCLGLFHLKIL